MAESKRRGKRGNPNPNQENLKKFGIDKPPPTHEQAVETGRRGGIASAKSQRTAIRMDDAFIAVMGKRVTGEIKRVLEANGYDAEELDNAHAVFATLVTLALKNGDLQAIKILTDYSQAITEEARKSEESRIRIEAMKANAGADMNINSSDDDDGGVVIYLPQIEEDDEDASEKQTEE